MSMVQLPLLRELCKTNMVQEACAIGTRGGFMLRVLIGGHVFVLGTQRGQVRLYTSLGLLAGFLRRELGLGRLLVELDKLELTPKSNRKKKHKEAGAVT